MSYPKDNQCFRYECKEYVSWYRYLGKKDKKTGLLLCESLTVYKDDNHWEVVEKTGVNWAHLRTAKMVGISRFRNAKEAFGLILLSYCTPKQYRMLERIKKTLVEQLSK